MCKYLNLVVHKKPDSSLCTENAIKTIFSKKFIRELVKNPRPTFEKYDFGRTCNKQQHRWRVCLLTESWQNKVGSGHLVTKSCLNNHKTIMARSTSRTVLICLAFLSSCLFTLCEANLIQSRLQNRHLQRVLNHNRITIILEGVRSRALNSIQNDPIMLITFPQINHQFQVRKRKRIF